MTRIRVLRVRNSAEAIRAARLVAESRLAQRELQQEIDRIDLQVRTTLATLAKVVDLGYIPARFNLDGVRFDLDPGDGQPPMAVPYPQGRKVEPR